ncbi:MAG: hypothetical protein NT007_00100, partial [Candidatus Kapabacteria bacterium]|nr:hypothetical protein [Candidatus Kapabacteria bacterium]
MHTAKQILNDLITIKAGSINNFYSPQAKSYDGSVQWPTVCFKDLEKQGLIKRIPFNVKVINKRREVFYFVTKKGSDYIDRRCEQRDKEPKSYNNAIHESMKYDIALAFVRSFREFDIEFNYKADINGIRPD